MPNKIKQRDTFSVDATYLTRLLRSIEANVTKPPTWRAKAIAEIKQLINTLLDSES